MTTSPFPQPPSPPPGTGVPAPPGSGTGHPALPFPTPPDTGQAQARASTALGWAIAAAVGAGIAVVLSVIALVLASSGAFSGGDDGFYEPVRGQVVGLPDGASLSGDRLESAVDGAERDLGWTVDGLECPDTPSVRRSTAVVCTGTIDGDDWTGVVFFEDSVGSFVVGEF